MHVTETRLVGGRLQRVEADLEADPNSLKLEQALLAISHLAREMSPDQVQKAVEDQKHNPKGALIARYQRRVEELQGAKA